MLLESTIRQFRQKCGSSILSAKSQSDDEESQSSAAPREIAMSKGVVDLADQVTQRWNSRIPPHRKASTVVPDRANLIALLDVAFLASLTYDERRPTRFGIILCPEADRNRIISGSIGSSTIIGLADPLPFDPAQVRRLAPATEPSNVLIGIEPSGGDASTPFRIWGLVDTGSSWTGFLRHEREGGWNPPDLLTVTSTEPGHLHVSRLGKTIAILREGSIVLSGSYVLYEGPIAEFLDPARKACYSEVCLRL